jgi:ell wall binding domain 2 (CWB2)/WD40-like Beta Propeller Repeat
VRPADENATNGRRLRALATRQGFPGLKVTQESLAWSLGLAVACSSSVDAVGCCFDPPEGNAVKIVCGWTVATASVVVTLAFPSGPPTMATTHAAFASAVTPAPVPIAYPAYTRQNATITLGTTGTLRVVGSDGSSDHLLTTPTPVAGEVSWNPAGTKIAYVAALADGTNQVWTINTDGSGAHAVTPEGYQLPIWSPDGTKLAVVSVSTSADFFGNIAIADLAAGTTHLVTSNTFAAGSAFGPAVWAPDGSTLAFVTVVYDEGSGGDATINVINADGTGRRELPALMDPALNAPREIAWSPDGAWLAFDGYLAAGDNSRGALQIVHPDGTGLRTIDAGSATSYGDGDIGGFSPDGSRVLLTLWNETPTRVVAVALSGAVTTFHTAPALAADTGNAALDTDTSWLPSANEIEFCEQSYDGAQDMHASTLFATGTADSGLRHLTTSGQGCDGAVATASPRYAGSDRVATAISASRASFTHASAVVIARSDLYPDALAAAPLAGKVSGPVLLSPPGGATPALMAEIRRLGATTAYLIGDTTALSAKVGTDVAQAGVTTTVRIGGTSRYDTAADIAEWVGGTSAYVVRGDDWTDAAAVSALAAFQHRPVLLTSSETLALSAAKAVTAMRVTSATIVGGTRAVSTVAESGLNLLGVKTTRLAGADRWATSAAVASSAVAAGMTGPPWLASGLNWPDAVSAGPAAAASKGVLLLVAPTSLAASPASKAWLASHPSNLVVAVGGPDVVSAQDVALTGRS